MPTRTRLPSGRRPGYPRGMCTPLARLVFGVALSLAACGNDAAVQAPSEQDALSAAADALHERQSTLVPTDASAPDVPFDPADATAPDLPLAPADAADMVAAPEPDAEPDVPGGVAGSDGRVLGSGADATYAELYPCRDDTDCCVGVVSCRGDDPMVTSYLYSRAPGAPLPPAYAAKLSCDAGGYRLICDPYPIQVRCVSGQCVGRSAVNWQDTGTSLNRSHCGHVDVPDGGPDLDGLFVSDPSTATATSWICYFNVA